MYRCRNCGEEFIAPLHTVEKHGLDYAPYEEIEVCPYCRIADIEEVEDEDDEV